MHPKIFQQFEQLCQGRNWKGKILEVGTVPNQQSLLTMRCLSGVPEKLGMDLSGPFVLDGIPVVKGNANAMPFPDNKFDGVFCHAVIEHDPYFWKTAAEVKRVTKPGGLIVFGGPAFVELGLESWRTRVVRWLQLKKWVSKSNLIDCLVNSTLCFRVHAAPGDYYRFGEQAFKEVILEGLDEIDTRIMMAPPRILGIGRKPESKAA